MPIIRTSRAAFVVGAALGLSASYAVAWAEPVVESKPLILAQGAFGGGGGGGNNSVANPEDDKRKKHDEEERKRRQQQNQEQPPQQKRAMPGNDGLRNSAPDDGGRQPRSGFGQRGRQDDAPPPNMGQRGRPDDNPPPPPPSGFGQRGRQDDAPPPSSFGRRNRELNDAPPPNMGQRGRPDDAPPPSSFGRRNRELNDEPPPSVGQRRFPNDTPPPSTGQRGRQDDAPPPNMGQRGRQDDNPPPPPPSGFGQRVSPGDLPPKTVQPKPVAPVQQPKFTQPGAGTPPLGAGAPPPDGRAKSADEPRVRTFGDKREPRPDFGRKMPKDDAGQANSTLPGVWRKPAPEELGSRRRERQEFTRERLKDITVQRREIRDEGGHMVIQEPDNRRIFRDNGRAFIQHDETDRLRRSARDFREERGPRGERRTVFTRADGVMIVTVVDNDGRLVRRMRRDHDGRERILIDNRRERWHRHRGRAIGGFGFFVELPPPVIRIPRDEYYVDAGVASEDDIYYALSAPPVDEIEADYTLDEIRYSPSLRDRFRRVTVSTINFEFGSWELSEDQIDRLEVVARAIRAILRRSPDEVFLISGHTDAVGSDEDNLSLSDRRAETVARVLSDEFGIAAENLVTQGYGEQYLLINSQEPERRNRRVEFQRITEALARGDD